MKRMLMIAILFSFVGSASVQAQTETQTDNKVRDNKPLRGKVVGVEVFRSRTSRPSMLQPVEKELIALGAIVGTRREVNRYYTGNETVHCGGVGVDICIEIGEIVQHQRNNDNLNRGGSYRVKGQTIRYRSRNRANTQIVATYVRFVGFRGNESFVIASEEADSSVIGGTTSYTVGTSGKVNIEQSGGGGTQKDAKFEGYRDGVVRALRAGVPTMLENYRVLQQR